MTELTSSNGTLTFGKGYPTMLINDQLHVINKPASIIEPIKEGNIDYFLELARWGKSIGTDMTAILITHPEIDEVDILPKLAKSILKETGSPVGLDTRNPEAIEAALIEIAPYKSIIWTVTAEQNVLESLLPIAKKYKAVVAGMPMGLSGSGVPMTVPDRIAAANKIIESCLEIGIPQEDIVMDAICMPAALLQKNSYQVTLETINSLYRMGITTQLGVGNSSSNMPDRQAIDFAYLLGALSWGLDSAMINPGISGLISSVRAMDFLTERDPDSKRFLKHYRSTKSN
ncbi:MAG: dihydropteroate synthase [Anaerolineaceae bacterium]|jgi:5-methyltetrahydrofolate--homocysteine methyltransferase|nr:dihydropteroate synthase [Anaerolineaceae bacterium]